MLVKWNNHVSFISSHWYSAIAMGIVEYLQVMLFVFNLTLSTAAKKAVNCQNFKFVIDEDVVYNHILEGHVFQRLTVHSAIQCHVKCKDDCLCVSMNYFPYSMENNCELNAANKDMEPAAMKRRQEGNYYDLVRSYTVKVRWHCLWNSFFIYLWTFVNKINIPTWSSFPVLLKRQVFFKMCYMSVRAKKILCIPFCLRYDWFRQNQNKLIWLREDWVHYLSRKLFLSGHVAMRRGRQNQSDNKLHKDVIDLTIAVLLHFKWNFDGHFISILAPRYVLRAHVLCSHCLLSIRSASNKICRWLLKRTCQPNSMSMLS